jgi:hypothetical protein
LPQKSAKILNKLHFISIKATFNVSANTVRQRCSPAQSVCKKDTLSLSTTQRLVRFCCLSSDNCNIVDWSETQAVLRIAKLNSWFFADASSHAQRSVALNVTLLVLTLIHTISSLISV